LQYSINFFVRNLSFSALTHCIALAVFRYDKSSRSRVVGGPFESLPDLRTTASRLAKYWDVNSAVSSVLAMISVANTPKPSGKALAKLYTNLRRDIFGVVSRTKLRLKPYDNTAGCSSGIKEVTAT
jgi:hypothetical protein